MFLASISWIAGNNLRLTVTFARSCSACHLDRVSAASDPPRIWRSCRGGFVPGAVLFSTAVISWLDAKRDLRPGLVVRWVSHCCWTRLTVKRRFILGLGLVCLGTGLNVQPRSISHTALPAAGNDLALAVGPGTGVVDCSGRGLLRRAYFGRKFWASLRQSASEEGMLFSNLVYSVYGTIHGGDWTLAYKDHPEIFKLPEGYASHPELYIVPGTQAKSLAVLTIVESDVRNQPSLDLERRNSRLGCISDEPRRPLRLHPKLDRGETG